ncbi:Pr6Pr family membrane protein [Microbacterium sp.]|uniref:Pr6Pr family membrane protein n=1 Tax=Microbacterium sp. TaxID=51671 RepID=UPI003A915B02
MRMWWQGLRLVAAALIVAALAAQAQVTIGGAIDGGRDVATTTVNFFSFFTVISNLLAALVLVWAGVRGLTTGRKDPLEPRALAVALACVTTYMIVTGVVYNTLLRGIPLPQGTTVAWANEVLHVVGPVFLLLDLLFAPGRRRLAWGTIGGVLVFPLAWVVYTLVRGPLTVNPANGEEWWYPYPFVNPHNFANGYGTVSLYIVGIAVGIALVALFTVWVGRRRAR